MFTGSEAYLLKPPEAGDPRSVWIGLHGAFAGAAQSLDLFGPLAAAHEALLLAPQASRPAGEGFAWSFARDLASITQALEDVASAHPKATTALGLCGFSMGCTMALWLLAHHPGRFRFCALFGMGSAFEPWELDDGGIPRDRLRLSAGSTPIFLAVDQQDPAGCSTYLDANAGTLRNLGFRVEVFSPNERQHWVTPMMQQAFSEWLRGIESTR